MASTCHPLYRPVGPICRSILCAKQPRVRLRRPRAGLLEVTISRSIGPLSDDNLLRRKTRFARESRLAVVRHLKPFSSASACSTISTRGTKSIVPEQIWGDGKPDGVRRRAESRKMKEHGPSGPEARVGVVNWLYGLEHLAPRLRFPPDPAGE